MELSKLSLVIIDCCNKLMANWVISCRFFARGMSVCMIPSDASHEEAVEWVVFSLEQLINLSNQVFESLSNRIKNFSEHIDRIQLDLGRVAKKIEQIREVSDDFCRNGLLFPTPTYYQVFICICQHVLQKIVKMRLKNCWLW